MFIHTEGLAFCFLPLPLITGLPVHVNGYFELSQNRRDIWCERLHWVLSVAHHRGYHQARV